MTIRGKVRLLLVLMLTAFVGASDQGFTRDESGKGQIVFTTDRDNPSPLGMCPDCEEIYIMNPVPDPDSTQAKRLTTNNANDNGPAWSPNAKTIAFHSNRFGIPPQLFLMNADGTDQHRLTDLLEGGAFPSWSRNGRRVCFHGFVQPRDIFIINADGTGLTNLTNDPEDPGDDGYVDFRCDWSPKGKKIAFGSIRNGNEDIYVMDEDGSHPVRLTESAGPDANPDWSPRGDRIAFESNRDGNPEIYVMNADGSDPVRLTFFPGQDTKPSWSPKGDRIAFHRRIAGHGQVFIMNADGTDVTQITFTPDPGFSAFPSWGKGHLAADDDDHGDDESDDDDEGDDGL